MIDTVYAFFEKRILAREALRRGRRLAGRVEAAEGAVGSLEEVAARVADAKVVSFDLFDTLLLRRGLSPEAIDRKVAGFARAFAGARAGDAVWAAKHMIGGRLKAEMIATGAGDEPLLRDIYAEALRGAGAATAETLASNLVALETAVEARGICAAPGAKTLLTALKARGQKVVATSDMFLEKPQIEALLTAAGIREYFDEVFVSADLRWTKRGGRIFALVTDRLGVAPEDIAHIGDREDSDVAPARAAGWRAIHLVNREEITETEAARITESHIPSPRLRRNRVAAALRIGDARLISAEDVAQRLFGPACGLIALTALTHARRIEANTIYHLTRDATVIGEIIEAAREAHPWLASQGLKVRELAISRAMGARLQIRRPEEIWRLANLAPYLAGGPFNADCITRAFGLLREAFTAEALTAEGGVLTALLHEDRHARPLFEALEAARAPVENYLREMGVFGAAPAVAIDIGYSGTFGHQLSEAFFADPAEGRRLDFLFLLTSRYFKGNVKRMHPAIRINPGVALDHRRRSSRWPTWNFAWAEPFLVDPDRGRLEGYENGAPVFAAPPLDESARAQARVIRSAIRAGALRFIDDFHGAPGDLEEVAALLHAEMIRFAGKPTGAEVEAVRSLSHQSGQVALDARDPTRQINPLRIAGELQSLKTNDYWVQGSLRRSGLGLMNLAMADRPERDRREDPRWPTD